MSGSTLGPTIKRGLAASFRTLVFGLAIYGGLDLIHSALAQDDATLYLPSVATAAEVQSLETRVAALESLLSHVGRKGNDIYVSGANLYVVNGTGKTESAPNGLGNVIIGYNEERSGYGAVNDRSGSHMLVVGAFNNYSGVGGIVSGWFNSASGDWSSVIGGQLNTASGDWSSVSGGYGNNAGGASSSVSGGQNRSVEGSNNWRAGELFQAE